MGKKTIEIIKTHLNVRNLSDLYQDKWYQNFPLERVVKNFKEHISKYTDSEMNEELDFISQIEDKLDIIRKEEKSKDDKIKNLNSILENIINDYNVNILNYINPDLVSDVAKEKIEKLFNRKEKLEKLSKIDK